MNCFNISIAERYRPFSKQPGTFFPIPYSPYAVEIYPTKLKFFSLQGEEEFSLQWDLKGDIEQFSIICDLEKGVLRVSFFCSQVFYRYLIFFDQKLYLKREKGELFGLLPEQIAYAETIPSRPLFERFSFGCSKQQEVERVRGRSEIKEILPLWFMLGQTMSKSNAYNGLTSLDQIVKLYQTSTRGLMVPDFMLHESFGAQKPLGNDLLYSIYLAIRSLFFSEESGQLHICPKLDAGRMTGLRFSLGTLDLEWSKHRLRRVAIHAEKSGKIALAWPKEVISYRLRPTLSENELPSLDIQAGSHYFFDNFLCR